jgi:metal-responsive CopG/Arc/MetJ family transcriptional regulator
MDVHKTQRLNILLSESLLTRIGRVAASRGISKSAFVRLAIEKELEESREQELRKVAEALAPLYKTNEELTAFSALDGEDWHE